MGRIPIDECTEPSGDPIVIHDQFADRWILTQFTTRGINYPDEPLNLFYNCVAISTTSDPTGSYYRYAFTTGYNFPDYPKYGVWRDSYLITTREFGIQDESIYGIGVYGLERNKMIEGDPNARAVSFLLREGPVPLNLIGDGLLPPDIDGKTKPMNDVPAPIVGTQDDDAPVRRDVRRPQHLGVRREVAVEAHGVDRDEDAATGRRVRLDLPVRADRPRLPATAGSHGSGAISRHPLVQAAADLAARVPQLQELRVLGDEPVGGGDAWHRRNPWYELRRSGGTYSLQQQSTYAPGDGIHRWMGSIAQDKNGSMALGYSVVNSTDVYPGIRYTGRLAGDPLGQMTLGEGVVINGTASQTHTNSRWGDYTSMNVDPVDDCTFWYVNEYYTVEGAAQAPLGNGWQTRIASFRLPGC